MSSSSSSSTSASSDRYIRALMQPIKIVSMHVTVVVEGVTGNYVVNDNGDRVTCTCPDSQHRGDTVDCKHIVHYKMKVNSDRPACPYGSDCYRQNLLHHMEYTHPDKHKPSQPTDSSSS